MPLKHKSTKKSHTNNFVGFCDLVFLWQESIFTIAFRKIASPRVLGAMTIGSSRYEFFTYRFSF